MDILFYSTFVFKTVAKSFELGPLFNGISHTNQGPLEPLAHSPVFVCVSLQAAVMCSVPAVVQQCAMHDKKPKIAGKAV